MKYECESLQNQTLYDWKINCTVYCVDENWRATLKNLFATGNMAGSLKVILNEFKAVENSRALAIFSNKYFFLNQFRELKFYFDYVI